MSAPLAPASVSELLDVVRSCPRLLAVGAETKPRMSQVEVTKLSMLRLRGIIEYEPSEFTFTALAGTPVSELESTLASRGQYLPFDPFLSQSGATLGGTLAAGLSGPGRLRFGGLKDFILGVRFVDGLGRILRVGGKVVKNAAGFDLPKFFVGSVGRFGVLTELTFKVFPAPVSRLTLKLAIANIETASRILGEAANARWEPDAVDVLPGTCDVCLRLAGPAEAIEEIAIEILSRWPGEKLSTQTAQNLWAGLGDFRWACADAPLIKVALTPVVLSTLYRELQSLEGIRIHVTSGGNVAFISLPLETASQQSGDGFSLSPSKGERAMGNPHNSQRQSNLLPKLNGVLSRLRLSGVILRGNGPLWCGFQSRPTIAQAVKQALDPQNRFPGLDE